MDKELKQMFLERRCADDQPVYAKKNLNITND